MGYSAVDVREILFDTMNYLLCSSTGDESDPSRGDFLAVNSYSFCGNSSFTKAGYNVLVENFKESGVPTFFSEYGCNVSPPRLFTEVPVIYGPLVLPVMSGGVVYEYAEEPSNFGLVQLNDDGSAKLKPDYDSLQKQIGLLNTKLIQDMKAGGTSIKPKKCNSALITTSTFNDNFTIPAVPAGGQRFIDNGIPDAPRGKLINVEVTKVTQKVQRSNGNVIQNLEINPMFDTVEKGPDITSPSKDTEMNLNETNSILEGAQVETNDLIPVNTSALMSSTITVPMKSSKASRIHHSIIGLTLLNNILSLLSFSCVIFF